MIEAAGQYDDPSASRLAEREIVIEPGLNGFLEVGQALMEVRDSKLWRA
jgi:hypothetical protein